MQLDLTFSLGWNNVIPKDKAHSTQFAKGSIIQSYFEKELKHNCHVCEKVILPVLEYYLISRKQFNISNSYFFLDTIAFHPECFEEVAGKDYIFEERKQE